MKLTSSERRAIFRPNVMMQRLDQQESKFVQNAMGWVRIQAENIIIQFSSGIAVNKLTLLPSAVRGIAQVLASSMIDTYGLGEISFQNELLQAEQIKRAKQSGSYTPNIVPFAATREDEIDNDGSPFTPRVGLDWYNNYTLRLSGVHSVDALEYAKGVISTGIEQGLAQPIVMNLLRERFLALSEQRLENIARTETAKIYEQSRYQLMNDNEEVVGYEFAAIMDSRTSVICSSRDGKFIRKGEEEGWLPPLHFQCRSVLLPIFAWEQGIKYSMPELVTKPQKGFGSTDMVIPETARNKIYIGGIPELRKSI